MRYACMLCALFTAPLLGQEAAGETSATDVLAPHRKTAVKKWESEIVKLELKDRETPDPDDAVLFIGSSSIRRWDTIVEDMAPYRPIQRGYGGSKFSDVAVFAERLIHPHKYRALVMFVGNDVSGKDTDHTPDQIERFVRHIIGVSQSHQPAAPIFIIEVTPTQKRFAAWDKIRESNARLREIALTTANTYFIATAEHYLDAQAMPRNDLFVEDLLHLNRDGYRLWATLIRRRLDDVMR